MSVCIFLKSFIPSILLVSETDKSFINNSPFTSNIAGVYHYDGIQRLHKAIKIAVLMNSILLAKVIYMTEEEFLVPQEQYLKAGIHIGTKFKTGYMSEFIYKTRPDGLSVLNLQRIDERIGIAAKFLARYEPEDIVIASRRENGWKPVNLFGKLTGVRVFAGRYPPGIMTNPNLKNFIEPKVILITDPWPDKNVIKDAVLAGVPVIGLCDTNNQPDNLDLVVPCNNKGKKSLGIFFYIIAREYLREKLGKEITHTYEDFSDE